MQTKKGILVGGGPINYPFLRQELAKEYDLLVALDHGARVLDDLGRLPAVVLGDYDSLSPSDQAYFRAQGSDSSPLQMIKTGPILKSDWSSPPREPHGTPGLWDSGQARSYARESVFAG